MLMQLRPRAPAKSATQVDAASSDDDQDAPSSDEEDHHNASSDDPEFDPRRPLDGALSRERQRKRLRLAARLPPLPMDLWGMIWEFVPVSRTLHTLSLTCKALHRKYCNVPVDTLLRLSAFVYVRRYAEQLKDFGTQRIRQLAFCRRCEFCGRDNVHGGVKVNSRFYGDGGVYVVYAHDDCIRDQLIHCYYVQHHDWYSLAVGPASTASARGRPAIVTLSGYNPRLARAGLGGEWVSNYMWKDPHPCLLPGLLTVDDLCRAQRGMSRQQLKAEFTQRHDEEEKKEADLAERRKRRREELMAVREKALDRRMKRLDKALEEAHLPGRDELDELDRRRPSWEVYGAYGKLLKKSKQTLAATLDRIRELVAEDYLLQHEDQVEREQEEE